jgi:hypothetical protein
MGFGLVDGILGLSIVIAGLLTAVLLGLGMAVFVRRRSRSYLLIALALLALFGRSVVAGGTLLGLISPGLHHLLEHGLDIIMAALVVAAVYYARTVEQSRCSRGEIGHE